MKAVRRAMILVLVAGAAGGLLDAVLNSQLALPRVVHVDGSTIVVPGILGNLVIGALAAILSYGLYGPLSNVSLLRGPEDEPPPTVRLTVASFVGAILVGYSGGQWISAEAEKRLNHATAVRAAERLQSVQPAGNGANAPPDALTPARARNLGQSLLQSLRSDKPLQSFDFVEQNKHDATEDE